MSPLVRVLSAPAVVAVVVAGIWITGGSITNGFGIAMWLTGAWMALAGGLAVLVAVKSRPLRVPVLGAYVVTAAVATLYLSSSTVLDNEVSETVATADPAPMVAASPMTAEAEETASTRPARPRNVLQRSGRFSGVRHPARGQAQVIRLSRGGRVLTLTGFRTDNGPDLRVYLVAGDPRSEEQVSDFVDLGALKGNVGDQQYRLPDDVDTGRYDTVVVWCRAFSVLFGRAPLRVA